MQPISDITIHHYNPSETKKRALPAPASNETPSLESSSLKKAAIRTIILEPQPVQTSIINTASPIAKCLSILVRQITKSEIEKIEKRDSTYTIETKKSKIAMTLSVDHERFINDIDTVAQDSLVPLFISPIACKINGESFNFSLFSLFFSKSAFVTTIINKLREKRPGEVFLTLAASFLLQPLENPFLNPEYEFLGHVYLYNVSRLTADRSVYCEDEEVARFSQASIHFKSKNAKEGITFPFEAFHLREAERVSSNACFPSTDYVDYFIEKKRAGEIKIGRECLILSQENRILKTSETIRFIKEDYLNIKRHYFAIMLGIRPDRITIIDQHYDGNLYLVNFKIDENCFKAYLNSTQEAIVSRTNAILRRPKDLITAFVNYVRVVSTNDYNRSYYISLFSLFYSNSPATESLIAFLLDKYRDVNHLPKDFLGLAASFALSPFKQNLNPYLNPDCHKTLSIFYENLKQLNGGRSEFNSNEGERNVLIESTSWKLVSGDVLKQTVEVANPYFREAKAIAERSNWITTDHIMSWRMFLSEIGEIDATIPNEFKFKHEGLSYSLTGCVAKSSIFNEIVSKLRRELNEPAIKTTEVSSLKRVDPDKVKERISSVIKPYIGENNFNYHVKSRDSIYVIAISCKDNTYKVRLTSEQYNVLFYGEPSVEGLLTQIVINDQKTQNVYTTCLLSLFYDKSPFVENFVEKIKTSPHLEKIIVHAAFFATQVFTKGGPFVNPSVLSLTANFLNHLNELRSAFGNARKIEALDSSIQIGKDVWPAPRDAVTSYKNGYYFEALEAKNQKNALKTDHTLSWKRFLERVADFVPAENSVKFSYDEQNYQIFGITALDERFKKISSLKASQLDGQKHNQILSRIKQLLAPLSFPIEDYNYENHCIEIRTDQNCIKIHILKPLFEILIGNFSKISNIDDLKQSIRIEIQYGKGTPIVFHTCLLSLFYENTDYTKKLISLFKPYATIPFMAEAASFALWPYLYLGGKNLNLYKRADFEEKSGILLDNLDALNGNKNMFPWRVERLSPITVNGKKRFLAPSKIASSLYELNPYRHEALICSKECGDDFRTDHTLLWERFYENVSSYTVLRDALRIEYKNQTIEFKNAPIAADKNFSAIIENGTLSLEEALLTSENLSAKSAAFEEAPQASIKPEKPYLQIADTIEAYWFQNAVNYSLWIKLLIDSKGVFSFEALPDKLMEPLKSFNKEDVAYVLKFFGIGKDLFKGDLSNEIAEKAIPTLLRVKAAEFKLFKAALLQERETKTIEIKPCYLVKPAQRLVHSIKVYARFDEYGLLSGFILNGTDAEEKELSIDAFNRLVEAGKEKKVLVLMHETVKLVEEAPLDPPLKLKRSREEEGKASDTEKAPKEAKEAPILPPVPKQKIMKRPLESEGTVHPKAPKEAKFRDKGDIATDHEKALGKPLPGGIVAPPQIVDLPEAPLLQKALTLDELFSALSANAGAQVSQVVKAGINKFKAIFTEEPLLYEGLDRIARLEKTPRCTLSPLVPKAKKYQWDFVLEVKRREEAGLGTILAPYMGLGKTWIYVSKVILSLYEGAKGHHLIITPKPLRNTIYKDACTILNNARLNAFIHLKSRKWGNTLASQVIKENNREEKAFLLSLLGLFDEADFNAIMGDRGPFINELVINFAGERFKEHPSKLKRLFEYCRSIAPQELPLKGSFDEKGLERILSFSISSIKVCDEANELVDYVSNEKPFIIIASYEQMKLLALNPKKASECSSLIFDEAQKIHNPATNLAEWAEKLLKALNPRSKIAVTGTPIENGIEDLFQLVGLVAPELKCPAILSTLSNLSTNASRFLKAMQPDLALAHLLKFHGHLQAYLNRISCHLALVLPKEDPRVKEAWGEGAKLEYHTENIVLPELAKRKYDEAHELFKTRKVDLAKGKKLDSIFSYYARVSSLLLDPELEVENLTPSDPKVQKTLKWIKKEATHEEIERLIERSPLLKAITASPKTLQAVQDKRVALIFVANIAVGKIVRKILKKKFPEASGTESYIMHGSQSQEKKDRIIDKLKENGKSKFGVLSFDSGSTGFSIPDAYLTILTVDPYNPASVLQALGRMNRATSTGLKIALNLRFGIFSEEHIPVVQSIKKLTYKNFFSPAETQLERLNDMASLIRNNIYQSLLNEKRDAALAKEEIEKVDVLIKTMLSGIEEEELKAFVERLTPPLPKYVPTPLKADIVAKGTLPPLQASFVRGETETLSVPSQPIRIPGNQLFKLPLPKSLSKEDKIRLAAFIRQNRKALDAPIKEIYREFKNPQLRESVREEKAMPTPESAKAYQTLVCLIQEAKSLRLPLAEIGVDYFRIEGQEYVLDSQANETSLNRVKLVKGMNDVCEILI